MDITSKNHGGNKQSRAANKLTNKKKHRAMIYAYLARKGMRGATVYEITQALGIRHQTASARCSELKADKIIIPSGEKRKTETGASASVLVLKVYHDT